MKKLKKSSPQIMFSVFFCNADTLLRAYGLGLFIATLWLIKVQVDVRINDWIGRFYSELTTGSGTTLIPNATNAEQIAYHSSNTTWDSALFFVPDDYSPAMSDLVCEFMLLSSMSLFGLPIINFLTRHWALMWREEITRDYLGRWMALQAKPEFEGFDSKGVDSPSQRVQDDAYRFARYIDRIGQGWFASALQIAAFAPVLWRLSARISGLPEGILVWLMVGGNVLGLLISLVVGSRLVGLEYQNQAVEATFRKELIYVEDRKLGGLTLSGLVDSFIEVRTNYRRLFLHMTYFELWSTGFNQAMLLLPMMLLVGPVMSGRMELARYLQAIQAFNKVHSAMSVLMAQWIDINELFSVMRRLREFEDALPESATTISVITKATTRVKKKEDERTPLVVAAAPSE